MRFSDLIRFQANTGFQAMICLGCLSLPIAPAAAETKTAQQCYKEDSNWTVSCGALEGPQQIRDDCFRMADRKLGSCLDSVGKTSEVGPATPDLPARRVIERAPLHILQGGGTGN